MNKNTLIVIIIIIVVILGLVWAFNKTPSNTEVNPTPGTGEENSTSNPPAAEAARKDLALKLGIPANTILITKVTDMNWSDSCLGLGKANESCLQAVVPGYKVEMQVNVKNYVYRTDKTGAVIRAETE